MFEGDYTIYGKHATYIKYLKEAKVFSRYIDVYMAGAVLGALYEKRVRPILRIELEFTPMHSIRSMPVVMKSLK